MDIIEQAVKKVTETSLLDADQAYNEVKYNLGDLVLLARPRIGVRKEGTATRLQFQTFGPFEVVEKISEVTYRLRKCGTEAISSHHMKFMNPYLAREAYQVETSKTGSNEPDKGIRSESEEDAARDCSPRTGDFMFLMGLRAPTEVPRMVPCKSGRVR